MQRNPPRIISNRHLPRLSRRRHLGEAAIVTADESDLEAAEAIARSADAVVVVVGYTAREEGEYVPGDISLGQEGGGAVTDTQ